MLVTEKNTHTQESSVERRVSAMKKKRRDPAENVNNDKGGSTLDVREIKTICFSDTI